MKFNCLNFSCFRIVVLIAVFSILFVSIASSAYALEGEKFYGYVDKAYQGMIKAKLPSKNNIVIAQTNIEEFFNSDKFSGRYGFRENLIVLSCDAENSNSLNCAHENDQIDFYINNQYVGSNIFEINRETKIDFKYSSIPHATLDVVEVAYIDEPVMIHSQIKEGIRPYYISSFECNGNISYLTPGVYGDQNNVATLTESPEMTCTYEQEGNYFITLKGFDSMNNDFFISLPVKIVDSEKYSTSQCIPKWDCTDFSICSIAQDKLRKCTDMEQCNDNSQKPLEKIFCIYNKECTSNWKCTEWTECVDGTKQRICNDLNFCNKEKPAIEKDCGVNAIMTPSETTEFVVKETVSPITWIMALLLILIGSTAAYHNTKRAIERKSRSNQVN